MGDPSATDDDVINAAKKCGCHDFIMQLENGYKTIVGGAEDISRAVKDSVYP